MKSFEKSFTQQEAIPDAGIDAAVEILRGGRLHRYNIAPGEISETSLLEEEYAAYQEAKYCLAVTSGGQAMQIALRAAGLKPGDKILANAYTLAPVPGAIHACGGVPVFVEIGQDWLTDLDDLEAKAAESGAKFFMLSHMRGHIADMDRVVEICERHGIRLIEDCAHTMGAKWQGKRS
ncbi:MAG: aminotransferase class I/II-fold pyridoxal phosphate-dependent enzyme, partial [Alphaproteobacteria bacterium]